MQSQQEKQGQQVGWIQQPQTANNVGAQRRLGGAWGLLDLRQPEDESADNEEKLRPSLPPCCKDTRHACPITVTVENHNMTACDPAKTVQRDDPHHGNSLPEALIWPVDGAACSKR
mmetsp:Transcript_67880/g.133520  ORF Transcript_67880/g.133520 Transcript_67880/m.133520 type:complete len:116 (-) Transcript_67880:1-348(-)